MKKETQILKAMKYESVPREVEVGYCKTEDCDTPCYKGICFHCLLKQLLALWKAEEK